MNLRIFLSELDRLAETMSSSQLQAFIHENGRTLPEPLRADYLKTLESFALPCKKDKTAAKQDFDFEQEYERLCGLLHQISEGELCLNGQSNYEYNDWYGGASDELFYQIQTVLQILSAKRAPMCIVVWTAKNISLDTRLQKSWSR